MCEIGRSQALTPPYRSTIVPTHFDALQPKGGPNRITLPLRETKSRELELGLGCCLLRFVRPVSVIYNAHISVRGGQDFLVFVGLVSKRREERKQEGKKEGRKRSEGR
ncbi:hypothetical protein PNOK_0632900 [Pyrrhoderma noxium]|uniref:Uncharacterized protein n=1 Tax=Pyrrhoderma noxium TaxID=2282107 RepID=A0A286UE25_9AGAM|nr:hypothetical protein PNOK_0632900 [Pyrrhoderma noxium]